MTQSGHKDDTKKGYLGISFFPCGGGKTGNKGGVGGGVRLRLKGKIT